MHSRKQTRIYRRIRCANPLAKYRPQSTALEAVALRPPDKMKNTMCRETCRAPQTWQAYAPARARTRTECADSMQIPHEDGPPAAAWPTRLEFLQSSREQPTWAWRASTPDRPPGSPDAGRPGCGQPRTDHRCLPSDWFLR